MSQKAFLLLVTIFIINLFPMMCKAQAKKGDIGITAAIQDLQLDFNIPFWVSDKAVLAPAFGLLHASGKATDITLGLAVRGYFKKEKLSSYSGARFGSFILSPKDGDTLVDFLAGVFLGAEYFFDSKFSVGGELQLNVTKSDEFSGRFGNPDGTNFNTATALFITFYLK